jgi:hypothetical protein
MPSVMKDGSYTETRRDLLSMSRSCSIVSQGRRLWIIL